MRSVRSQLPPDGDLLRVGWITRFVLGQGVYKLVSHENMETPLYVKISGIYLNTQVSSSNILFHERE